MTVNESNTGGRRVSRRFVLPAIAVRLILVATALLALLAVLVELNASSPDAALLGAIQADSILVCLSLLIAVWETGHGTWVSYPSLRRPMAFVALLTIVVLSAHLYTISSPNTSTCFDATKEVNGCIMDETYYVPSALGLLSGTQCAPYAGNCNLEHPYLAKALIAAGVAAFGLNEFGWRVFDVLLGTASIPVFFALVLAMGGGKRLAYLATLALALDTMFFVHSGAALIDVPAIFFGLLAFLAYFGEVSFWKFDKFLLSGLFLGLAAMSKETSVFMLGALLAFDAVTSKGGLKSFVLTSAKVGGAAFLVLAVGLQAYDSLYVSSFPTFYDHVHFIIVYGGGLTGHGWFDNATNTYITPLNWLGLYTPVQYLVTHVTVSAGNVTQYSYVGVGYYGATNFVTTWLTFAWVPLATLSIFRTPETHGKDSEGEDRRPVLFALIWFAAGYLPYISLWLFGRVTYPFYILPAVPAMAIGAGYFLTRPWMPRPVRYGILLLAIVWFIYFYPDKSFLPESFRAVLNH